MTFNRLAALITAALTVGFGQAFAQDVTLTCTYKMTTESGQHSSTYQTSVVINSSNETINGRSDSDFEWRPNRISWKNTGVVAYREGCYTCNGYIDRGTGKFYEENDKDAWSYNDGRCEVSNNLF